MAILGSRSRGPALAVLLTLGVASALAACAGAPAMAPPAGDEGPRPGLPASTPAPPPGQGNGQLIDGVHVVRTGTLSLEVTDLPAAVDAGNRSVSTLGGYVGASQEQHAAGGGWANVTYRIPVERWDEALAGLRALGRVLDQHTEALDVTAQVVDLDARLANLRTTEAAFQAIMERATTITDVLKVQSELTAVRGEIERLTAQRDGLAQRAALATLTVHYEVPTTAAAQASEGWDPGREIEAAFASLVLIGQRLASLAIWLAIVVVPVVLPFALLAYVVYRIVRAREIRATMTPPSDPRR